MDSLWILRGSTITAIVGLLLLLRRCIRVRSEVSALKASSGGRLPTIHEFQTGNARKNLAEYSKVEHLGFVVDIVEPRAEKGILQEEALLSALHDRIVNGTDWYREVSNLSILSALAFTFYRLAQVIPTSGQLSQASLAPILSLVGATWPLIGLGLAMYLFSTIVQKLRWDHFEAWRSWLETSIFPELGASRSTLRKLDSTLEEFTKTAREITTLLLPIQGLAPALNAFQGELVERLVPAIKDGLSRVSVGLSDQALQELRKSSVDSLRAVAAIQDNQARIASITARSESTIQEIAASVASVAHSSREMVDAMAGQTSNLVGNSERMEALQRELSFGVAAARTVSNGITTVLASAEKAIEANTVTMNRVSVQMHELKGEVLDSTTATRRLTGAVSQLEQVNLRTEQILATTADPFTATAALLPKLVENLGVLQERWRGAMQQMETLGSGVAGRTEVLEQNARLMSSALLEVRDEAQSLSARLAETGAELGELRTELMSVVHGSEEIATSLRDLPSIRDVLTSLAIPLQGTATLLPAFVNSLDGQPSRWSDAVLQMATLAEEVVKRTDVLDQNAKALGDALAATNEELRSVSSQMAHTGTGVGLVHHELASLVAGTREITDAFKDLHALGQKLKHLGSSITGHFNVWQHDTKKVFDTAKSTSQSVDKSTRDLSVAAETVAKSINATLEHTERVVKELGEALRRLTPRGETSSLAASLSNQPAEIVEPDRLQPIPAVLSGVE